MGHIKKEVRHVSLLGQNSIRVNVEIGGQQDMCRHFFVKQDFETGHGVDATFKLQLGSRDRRGGLEK